jgi:hypothetical protein
MPRRAGKLTEEDYVKVGRAIEELVVNDYIDSLHSTPRQIWNSFVRGMFMGLGGVLGATVVLAGLLWVLHLFGGFPVIGHYFQQTANTIRR